MNTFYLMHQPFKSAITLITIAAALLLSACSEKKPNDKLIQESLFKTVNDYSLYSEYFDITSWEKTNGWMDNDKYLVSASVNLKSKIDWLDLVSSCIEETLRSSEKGNEFQKSSYYMVAWQADMSGTGNAALDFWASKVDQSKIPQDLALMQSKLDGKKFTALYKACDYAMLDNYSNIISRELNKSDEITRTYTLTFRNTEKGWKFFN